MKNLGLAVIHTTFVNVVKAYVMQGMPGRVSKTDFDQQNKILKREFSIELPVVKIAAMLGASGWTSKKERFDGRVVSFYYPPAEFDPTCSLDIRLSHASVHFRFFNGKPEMLLENGSEDGGCFVVGEVELLAVSQRITGLLAQCANDGA
jgi:hypothetical protein